MQLMSEKNVKDISSAGAGRHRRISTAVHSISTIRTFGDLLSQMEEERGFQGLINKVCQAHNAEEYNGSTFPYLSDLYKFIAENADMCRVLLGANGDKAYTDRICGILRDDHLYDFVAHFYPNNDPTLLNYFCAFIISGNLSLALRWINTGMKESTDEMATPSLAEIIMHGVQVLQTKGPR